MRVIELYSGKMRAFMGKGGWACLAPLRYLLSVFYGLYSRSPSGSRKASEGPGRGSGPRVISIGNIEVGGGGKTPCVLALASWLRENGMRPAVISGGYGGMIASRGRAAIAGRDGSSAVGGVPEEYEVVDVREGSGGSPYYWTEMASKLGDEPVEYIREGIPLVIDRDKARGISVATRFFDPTHLILDDAFHRTDLAKDLDILLLDAAKPLGTGRLLPYGTLREPPEAIRRADAVVFTRSVERTIPAEALRFVEGKPVFFAAHEAVSLSRGDGARIDSAELAGKRVVLVSGIARPSSFEDTAREFGLDPEFSLRFDDHHSYTMRDIDRMTEESGVNACFVTTSKDWSKLAGIFPGSSDLVKLEMRMTIGGIEDLLRPVI